MSTQTVTVTDEMIHAAQAGDQDAMWQIVSAYEPVLVGIVRAVAPGAKPEDAENLLQEARVALIQHVHAYVTGSSAAQLSSFAYRSIRRSVAEEWVRHSVGLTAPASTVLRVRQLLWTTEGDIEAAWMIITSAANPTRRMSRESFMGIIDALANVECLDAPTGAGDGDDMTLGETIPDTSHELTDVAERRNLAHWLMTQIAPRQSFALRAFHGVGMEPMADAQIAGHLGIKPGSVQPYRAEAALRARMVADAHGIAA
ncbi:sigma factor [Streptomyces sp. NRRL S-378]|uniref:sigma factor n=1 Tax=Streptomyces sp. NRRL S-378 TaxID=1463904 RepID=UPI0006925BD5|nr:sigma factor [Streptomyces sp. NRRL S-378]